MDNDHILSVKDFADQVRDQLKERREETKDQLTIPTFSDDELRFTQGVALGYQRAIDLITQKVKRMTEAFQDD